MEWHRTVENTLIFNDLWLKICDGNTQPIEPNDAKKEIWIYKNSKALTLIRAFVNGEVYRHIQGCAHSWDALHKLKILFDSHSELELIQLQLKLFNLELKNGDVMSLALEIRAIKQDVDAVGGKVDMYLTTFIKHFFQHILLI